MLYLNIHGDAVLSPKPFHGLVIVDQQLSSVQLHVLETEARQVEQAQLASCDEFLGTNSDKLTVSTELISNEATSS